jgi:hypothetical protein
MLQLMESQKGTIVDMFNMFSGGALQRFSLFALNVVPYISSSIIIQLLVQILPSLKAIQKEGESGAARSRSGRAWARFRWRSSSPPASQSRCRTPVPATAFRWSTRRAWGSS